MSLRIIVKPEQIKNWITERRGTPARHRDGDEVVVLFDGEKVDYEPIGVDEFLEAMKLDHLVMLVDQEAGKTFHKIYRHS